MILHDAEWFAGANLPGDITIGVGNRTGPEFEISFGGSVYFGFGGGIDVTFSLNDFFYYYARAINYFR